MVRQQSRRLFCRTLIATTVTCGLYTGTALAEILGSAHDFSGHVGQNPEREICVFCHTPHNADTTVLGAPLWNHTLTNQTFSLYTSPTFDAASTIEQPGSNTILCLSCHDGTVAVDAYGGNPGSNWTLQGRMAIGSGGDLRDDHPVSFLYDQNLVDADGSLHNPLTETVTIGSGEHIKTGFIRDVLLFDDRLECASCHDVHNAFTQSEPLLIVSIEGSALCLTCHNK